MDHQMKSPWAIAALEEFHSSEADKPLFLIPTSTTIPANGFYMEVQEALGVLILLTDASIFADNAAFVAHKIISGEEDLPREFDPRKPLPNQSGPFRKRLQSLQRPLLEMILIRLVDNFSTYLTEITRECLASKAELLRSGETVRIDFILSHDNLEELKLALIDRKVNELAYLGFDSMCNWIEDRLGISITSIFAAREILIQGIESRNCIVHSRGIVTAKYLRNVPDSVYKAGDYLGLSMDTVYLIARATVEFVSQLDLKLSEKFNLKKTTKVDTQ